MQKKCGEQKRRTGNKCLYFPIDEWHILYVQCIEELALLWTRIEWRTFQKQDVENIVTFVSVIIFSIFSVNAFNDCFSSDLSVTIVVSLCVRACAIYLPIYASVRMRSRVDFFFSTSSFNFISMTMIWNRIINIVICWQLFPHPPRSLLPKFVIASLSISPLNYLREFRFRFSAALHLDLMTSNSICIFASTIQHLLRFGIVRTLNEIRICLSI